MSSNLRSSILTSAPGDAKSPSFSPGSVSDRVRLEWCGAHTLRHLCAACGKVTRRYNSHTTSGGTVFPAPRNGRRMGGRLPLPAAIANARESTRSPHSAARSVDRRTRRAGTRSLAGLSWTPDSKAMVMLDQCVPGGPRSLVLFSFATGEKRCLAAGSPGDFGLADDALSPDGRTAAFLRQTEAAMGEIYAVPLSGEVPRRLVSAVHSLTLEPDVDTRRQVHRFLLQPGKHGARLEGAGRRRPSRT